MIPTSVDLIDAVPISSGTTTILRILRNLTDTPRWTAMVTDITTYVLRTPNKSGGLDLLRGRCRARGRRGAARGQPVARESPATSAIIPGILVAHG